MKCHLVLISLFSVLQLSSNIHSVTSQETLKTEELIAEHRSAKPEPFLDRLAAFFSGGQNDKKFQHQHQQTSASVQRPVAVKPPLPPRPPGPPSLPKLTKPLPIRKSGPPRAQPVYQGQSYQGQSVAPSNNFATFVKPAFGNDLKRNINSQSAWEQSQPSNMAMIKDLQVQCEKDMMRVRILFDRPFYGMVFSKGHYSNVNCVHVPSGLGQTSATFDISLQSCGMSSSVNDAYGSPTPQGSFIENTIIIQYDPLLQEVWDQARRLRCTWYDFYEKAVTFRPYQVDMLDPVTANFLGDNLRCWMQIQVGKGPQAQEVSGIVKIGQTMTMVLGVKDDENKFDMMVRNCVAHDGTRAPIQLVDEKGCVSRPKIMSPFKKVKNFDTTANVLAYAYFQAFKFPDSMNVHFQCVVQVCRGACPEPQCGGGGPVALTTNTNTDGYGAPQAPTLDSYGSPAANPVGLNQRLDQRLDINPRLPGGNNQRVYQVAGSNPQPSFLKSDGSELSLAEPDKIVLTEPGYNNEFNKRSGLLPTMSLGGKPRSLELEEDIGETSSRSRDAKSALKSINAVDSSTGDDFEVHRKKRQVTDANGNRVLRVVKRDATEMAEVETTERIIQVLAPNDIQEVNLPLGAEEQAASQEHSGEEVVINFDGSVDAVNSSLCVDTSAFVGVTVTFIMILVVALITIVFLWMRIKSLDTKTKRCF